MCESRRRRRSPESISKHRVSLVNVYICLIYYHHRDRRRLRRRIPPCSNAMLSRNSLLLCLAHQSCSSSSPSHPALLLAADGGSTFVRPKLANLFTVQGHLWSPSIYNIPSPQSVWRWCSRVDLLIDSRKVASQLSFKTVDKEFWEIWYLRQLQSK